MEVSRVFLPGMNCHLCGVEIPEGTGIFALHQRKKSLNVCSSCFRSMLIVFEGKELIDLREVQGVWYVPGDQPYPPPIGHTRTKDPRVIYEEPAPPPPQEPPKYKPVIPPRRKPN